MSGTTKASEWAGRMLGLTLVYTALVMASMLLFCFDDLRFAHVMILQLPSAFVPIFILCALFQKGNKYLVSGSLVLTATVYETAYALWLISANSIVRVPMAETEELIGFSLLVGFLIFRLLFLYAICVILWNLFDTPLHERFSMKKGDLNFTEDVLRRYGSGWKDKATLYGHLIYEGYTFWLLAYAFALEGEMLLVAFADLRFLNWHLFMFFLAYVPALALVATFKNERSATGISNIIYAFGLLLLVGFIWVIIASVNHERIGHWTVIVFLILVALHFGISGFLAHSMHFMGLMNFDVRVRWWTQK
jgi:hypothetical protein